jgi:hypothetical protein
MTFDTTVRALIFNLLFVFKAFSAKRRFTAFAFNRLSQNVFTNMTHKSAFVIGFSLVIICYSIFSQIIISTSLFAFQHIMALVEILKPLTISFYLTKVALKIVLWAHISIMFKHIVFNYFALAEFTLTTFKLMLLKLVKGRYFIATQISKSAIEFYSLQ